MDSGGAVSSREALEKRTGIVLHGMDLHHLPKDTIFAWMLLHVMFPDYRQKLEKMNACIERKAGGRISEG